ncbi:ABC transporter permease [Cohnella abietis]|uniref:Transport permease protein n=1 Tax=Cohnella abietis TaxID=2507935 RepID=A0A3T1DC54_9BACL|nr:ABC transporter permease [Cohnella abietis]BBI35682.1 transport permease protein [Cohnella abietis]
MIKKAKELYAYRQMLKSLVLSDLRTRYKGSVLGFLWTFINPLLTLIVYTVVFTTVMRMNVEHYAIFMFIGLLPWLNFSSSILSSAGAVRRNSNLIKKIYFPHEVLPLSNVIGGIVNYLFGMIVLCIAIWIVGVNFSYHVVYFPIVLLLQFIFTMGLSLIVSAVTVYFRDVEHILGALMMAWFYFTPIVYPNSLIPEKYQSIFEANPVVSIFASYQDIFYYHRNLDWYAVGVGFIIAFILLFIGWLVFSRLKRNFAEEL